jgi:hypothetical protein
MLSVCAGPLTHTMLTTSGKCKADWDCMQRTLYMKWEHKRLVGRDKGVTQPADSFTMENKFF